MLTLYHHGSSACAAKVRFALEEKGLEWEGHYVDLLKGEQFSPEYLAINPKAVVPVLIHDGTVIPESTVICEYVDEVFPETPIYPRDPVLKARVRIWTKAVDEELHPACSAITYVVSHRHAILRNGLGDFEAFLAAGSGEGRTARLAKWRWIQQGLDAPGVDDKLRVYVGFLERMEQALADADWLVGDALSMADIAMAPYLYRLATLSMDAIWLGGKLPRIDAWYARIRSRDSFSRAFDHWMPAELAADMAANGRRAWPTIEAMLGA